MAKDSVREIWTQFASTTTCHGISNTYAAKGSSKRVFWLVTMTLMCSGVLYNIIMLTLRLRSFDVMLTVKLQTHSELVFPAVTVCNLNAIKRSAWSKYKGGSLTDDSARRRRSATATTSKRTKHSSYGRRRKKRATEAAVRCPVGYYGDSGICYHISGRKPYADAIQSCRNESTELATIHTAEQQTFIENIQNEYGIDVWLPITLDFYWSNGVKSGDGGISYTNWARGEPQEGVNCVMVPELAADSWVTDSCSNSHLFVCELRRGADCPVGWQEAADACYYSPTKRTSGLRVDDSCRQLHNESHAVVIDDETEGGLVTSNVTRDRPLWIGLRYTWRWLNGDDTSYDNWDSDQPKNEGKPCAALMNGGIWKVEYCDKTLIAVCATPGDTSGCPVGTQHQGDMCYSTHPKGQKYARARQTCQENGGEVVSINSQAEQDFIAYIARNQLEASVWIGADIWFVWTDGVRCGSAERPYTNWGADEPKVGELCTTLYQDKWGVTSCDERHLYICEMEVVPGTCPSGWQRNGSSCYYVAGGNAKALSVTDQCRELNASAYPVVIESEAEHSFITSITNSKKYYWIGLFMSFVWHDGSETTYANWFPGELGQQDKYCGILDADSGQWKAEDCTKQYYYLCSFIAPTLTSTEVTTTSSFAETTAVLPSTEETTAVSFHETTPNMTSAERTIAVSFAETSPAIVNESAFSSNAFTPEVSPTSKMATVDVTGPMAKDSRTSAAPLYRPTAVVGEAENTWTATDRSGESSTEAALDTTVEPATASADDNGQATTIGGLADSCPAFCQMEETTSGFHDDNGAPSGASGDVDGATDGSGGTAPTVERLMEEVAVLPRQLQHRLSNQADELIVDCQFAGVSCSHANFVRTWNPVLGNCFTFNSGWNQSEPLWVSYRPGHRHGLVILLNINQDEYIAGTANLAAARVVVHGQRTVPFPEDDGITIMPGRANLLSLRKFKTIHKEWPYSDCVQPSKQDLTLNMYQESNPVLYSNKACDKTCYQRIVVDECGCRDARASALTSWLDKDVCKEDNETQESCRRNVIKAANGGVCNCHSACSEELYKVTLSHSQWPSDVAEEDFILSVGRLVQSLFTDEKDKKKYRRNLIKLEVFYEDFNVKITEEEPAYQTTKYLSDIGGMLSLWFGCSAFTLIEFAELLCASVLIWIVHQYTQEKSDERPHLDHRLFYIFKETQIEKEWKMRRSMNSSQADYNVRVDLT